MSHYWSAKINTITLIGLILARKLFLCMTTTSVIPGKSPNRGSPWFKWSASRVAAVAVPRAERGVSLGQQPVEQPWPPRPGVAWKTTLGSTAGSAVTDIYSLATLATDVR